MRERPSAVVPPLSNSPLMPLLGFPPQTSGTPPGPSPSRASLPAGPVASTGSGPAAGAVTPDGDLADCAVGEGTDGEGRRSWRKRAAHGGRGRQSRRDPWAALPTEIRRGQSAGASRRLVLAGGPPPPACPVSPGLPPRWSAATTHLRAFRSHGVLRFLLSVPTWRPGVGHWGLPCWLTSLWAGLRTSGQAFSRLHRRRGAAAVGTCAEWIHTRSCVEPWPRNLSGVSLRHRSGPGRGVSCAHRGPALSLRAPGTFLQTLLYCSSATPS